MERLYHSANIPQTSHGKPDIWKYGSEDSITRAAQTSPLHSSSNYVDYYPQLGYKPPTPVPNFIEERFQSLDEILKQIKNLELAKKNENHILDEELWKIMNHLEIIKREWEENTITDEEINLRLQKRLAEVKTNLLPLVTAMGQTQNLGKEEVSNHSQESENEISRFDNDFRLKLDQRNWEILRLKSSKSVISNVVSVSGDTHVGKSTLIASLLQLNSNLRVIPQVAVPQQNSPTTANVNYYDHPNFSEELINVRFLDMEGENGGKPPKNALCEQLFSLLDAMGVTEYQERRRKAVAENLARLAFVVSDIVVYIYNESFANASYMTRVKKLAYDSTEGVDSSGSPALILVYNKCDLDEQFDVEKCTKEFFENMENLELKNLYSDIKCICIPHLDQMKKIRLPGKRTQYIDGEEIYALQIRKLYDLIATMLQNRTRHREAHGILFSERVWCILFRLVIERFHKKLRLGEILSYIMKPKHFLAAKAFDFFRNIYEFGQKFRPVEFRIARECAIHMLACLCIDHFRTKQMQFDKLVMNTLKSDGFQFTAKVMLKDLLDFIDKVAPCEAIYPGSFIDGNNRPILCTQEKMFHGNIHRTSERVLLPSSASRSITQLIQNVQFWVGIGYRPTWEGGHEMTYDKNEDDEVISFFKHIQFLSQLIPSTYFLTRVGIMQKATFFSRNPGRTNQGDSCWICLQNLPNKQLSGCHHSFCSSCIDTLQTFTNDQLPAQLNEAEDEKLGFEPCIQPSICPLCAAPFSSTSNLFYFTDTIASKFRSIFDYADLPVNNENESVVPSF